MTLRLAKKEEAMKTPKQEKTTETLRDILFAEIEQLQGPDGNPHRALAVANLAKQIISTAKVELDFHRTISDLKEKEGTTPALGTLVLGRG